MSRAPLSSRGDDGSVPPPPRSDAPQSELIAWCYEILRSKAWRDLPARVVALEESLGEEGSRAKGKPSTGLHKAVEDMAAGQERIVDRLDAIDKSLGDVLTAARGRADWGTWAVRVVLAVVLVALAGGAIGIVVTGARVQLGPAGAAAPPR